MPAASGGGVAMAAANTWHLRGRIKPVSSK
jgi:hypothetical protein